MRPDIFAFHILENVVSFISDKAGQMYSAVSVERVPDGALVALLAPPKMKVKYRSRAAHQPAEQNAVQQLTGLSNMYCEHILQLNLILYRLTANSREDVCQINTYLHFENEFSGVRYIRIGDLTCAPEYRNKGYCSKAITILKNLAGKYGAKEIRGRMSWVDTEDKTDPEHRARMVHFYEKHGFEIDEDDNICFKYQP